MRCRVQKRPRGILQARRNFADVCTSGGSHGSSWMQSGHASYTANVLGQECCVQYPDGCIGDAELHEPILDNPEAKAATRKIGKAVARRAGLSTDGRIQETFPHVWHLWESC